MCTEYLMTIYSPLESLTAEEYDKIMEEMATDNTEEDAGE